MSETREEILKDIEGAKAKNKADIEFLHRLMDEISEMNIADNDMETIFHSLELCNGKKVEYRVHVPKMGILQIQGTLKYYKSANEFRCVDDYGEEYTIMIFGKDTIQLLYRPVSIRDLGNDKIIFDNPYYEEPNDYVMKAKLFGKKATIKSMENLVNHKQAELEKYVAKRIEDLKKYEQSHLKIGRRN